MTSNATVWLLNRISELAQRCGVPPIDADIHLEFVGCEGFDKHSHFQLRAVNEGTGGTAQEAQKLYKMWALLGLDDSGYRRFDKLSEVSEAIERALSLAPRARTRD